MKSVIEIKKYCNYLFSLVKLVSEFSDEQNQLDQKHRLSRLKSPLVRCNWVEQLNVAGNKIVHGPFKQHTYNYVEVILIYN